MSVLVLCLSGRWFGFPCESERRQVEGEEKVLRFLGLC